MFDNKKGILKSTKGKIKYNYVSEIDQFLQELNNTHGAKSDSRIAEEQKYQRINALRDHSQVSLPEELPWKDF